MISLPFQFQAARMTSAKSALLGMVALFFSSSLSAQEGDGFRTWTNKEGKAVQAALVSASATDVVLRLADGRHVTIARAVLSEGDQGFLQQQGGGASSAATPAGWPAKPVTMDVKSVAISPGAQLPESRRFHYSTDTFEFIAFAPLADSVTKDVAADFELVKRGLSTLPWGWEPHPQKSGRYQIYFTETDDDYIAMGGDDRSSAATKDGKSFIKFRSLGLKKVGARYAFDARQKDTERVVSMTVRELMWEERLIMKRLIHSGMESFMRRLAYQSNGSLKFTGLENDFKKMVKEITGYGVSVDLRRMLTSYKADWNDRRSDAVKFLYENQLDGLMLFYFFGYLDGDRTGAALHDYMRSVVAETRVRGRNRGLDTAMADQLAERLTQGRDEAKLAADMIKGFETVGIKLTY